ncbi:CPBP family intramembrane metalloprotease [Mycobacterium decipiens]|uniref:CPBP family intramembrane metalloprotease n=1 Tax=Mycobacterium decipiens TaxID=1430326 RepID=A0A1X2LRB1_9MYCO|nr:CPBP family intramembrane metalloprotease [Mycobacterium decipiens]
MRSIAAAPPRMSRVVPPTTPVPMVRLSMSARELPASVPAWLGWQIPGGTVWAEEAAFRGALATVAAGTFGPAGGRILQAAAFGLSHIADARATGAPPVPTVLATGIAGWLFGWLADRSGSLAAPILTHLAINEAGALAAVTVQRRLKYRNAAVRTGAVVPVTVEQLTTARF